MYGGTARKCSSLPDEIRRPWYDTRRPLDEALFCACSSGFVEAVELLLSLGANPNYFHYNVEFLHMSSVLSAACRAPLAQSAKHGAEDRAEVIIRQLVAAGADVTRRSSTGETALHWATEAGLVQAVDDLVKAGADVNARTANGHKTPLMSAIERSSANCAGVISALCVAGADVNLADRAHFTALCYAVDSRDTSLAQQLLQNGASPDGLQDESVGIAPIAPMTTPLYLATSIGHREMIVLLIRWGADVNRSVRIIESRSTVFEVALHVNNFELVRLFLTSGVNMSTARLAIVDSLRAINPPMGLIELLSVVDRARLERLEKIMLEISEPFSLRHLCRLTIRKAVDGFKDLQKLPLPEAIKSFLSYDDL